MGLLLALLGGCEAAMPPAGDLGDSDGAPTDAAGPAADLTVRDGGLGTLKGTVMLTYYWVALQSDYPGANDTILCDVSTQTLATVPLAFANALRIEGTGKLTDGRMLNVGGSCACPSGMTTCYIVLDQTKYPWGLGVQSRALEPFRSIAVDRNFIAIGTKVYVPELDGVQMPASYGFLHDGCLVADDVGGGITGAHIDFFAAEKKNYQLLDGQLGLDDVTAYVDPPRCP
jgi:3D (Asp-Asp-Asp) domain-containing protein